MLASFVKTQGLAAPSAAETEEYRTFLETQRPIEERETRFINFLDDLVALRSPSTDYRLSSGARTPIPVVDTLSLCTLEMETQKSKPEAHLPPRRHDLSAPSLAAAIAISVVLPFLSVASITRFPTRAAVIWIVALGVLNPLLRAGGLRGAAVGSRDAVFWTGVYGGAMCAVAALVS